jgi:hypothetical protein
LFSTQYWFSWSVYSKPLKAGFTFFCAVIRANASVISF